LVDEKSFGLNVSKRFGVLRLAVSKVEVSEGSMERKHSVITCTLTVNNQEMPTHALIECAATGVASVAQHFARHHQ